ncbi:hypothetical protein D3879_09620 [Pseudomonas cavernicola]|uniref:Invasion protein n=1 Tax=Pseudomonas cavernicola TaxID=2320866 RepID=A0A418XLX8_9PSED|nr:hypothetical protein [Pseudomonas cavernicola]RJG13478.1 hypothetical protein D3879_09620 [Pseudomonas cavernicola]
MNRLIAAVVFLAFSSLAFAVEPIKVFGDWAVIRAAEGSDLVALTRNNDGNYIGLRCFVGERKCVHVLSVDFTCEVGMSYPMLVGSSVSAITIQTSCRNSAGSHELVLDDQSKIHEVLKQEGLVGFAMPMDSGLFKVVRFSLNGAYEAMGYVKKYTIEQVGSEVFL